MGPAISLFKDLKVLHFEFETFKEKEHRMEQVVNCAKTWTCPMADGYKLEHDGMVEASSLSGGPHGYKHEAPWLPQPPRLRVT